MNYRQYMYSYPHKTAYGPLPDLNITDYLPLLEETSDNSLYFHIPFCEAKCGYCNLFSVAGKNTELMEKYMSAMKRQSTQYSLNNIHFSEVTIGGGTPFYLNEKSLENLFALIEHILSLNKSYTAKPQKVRPVIMETSPRQTTEEKLVIAKAHGVTRLSMGIQSFLENELATLLRIHSPKDSHNALSLIKKVSFPCLNLDIIYGIPGQTKTSLTNTLSQTLSYNPEEVFLYPLYIKPGTPLYQKGVKTSEDLRYLYDCGNEYLLQHGYMRCSMRRYIRKDRANSIFAENASVNASPSDKYNNALNNECGFQNTLSIGCGGRSYIGNLHFCTPYAVSRKQCLSRLNEYINTPDYRIITHGYILDREEEKRRYLIKNILFVSGINDTRYQELFGNTLEHDFPVISSWLKQKYVIKYGEQYVLTDKGMAEADVLGPQLISEDVKERMKKWEHNITIGEI